jgi:hypothetical protein
LLAEAECEFAARGGLEGVARLGSRLHLKPRATPPAVRGNRHSNLWSTKRVGRSTTAGRN